MKVVPDGIKEWAAKYRFRFFLLSVGLLVVGVTWAIAANHECQKISRDRVYSSISALPSADVGLLLGTAKFTRTGKINLHFQHRIDAAVALYRAGKIRHLLVSGDNHVKDYNEPQDMKDALVAGGVPAGSITCDYAGFRTLDSVVRAHEVFGLDRFTIVTERFHCDRAVWIARQHGLDARAFAAPDVGKAGWALRANTREFLARAWCGLDLYLFRRGPRFPGPPQPISLAANS